MSNFRKLIELTETKAHLSGEMKELLNKELCLGMTRWVCRYGTLGEGFDKLTESQKYYQSLREIYSRANEVTRLRARAKDAHADFLDAKELLAKAKTESEKLRAESKIEIAELTAFELLVTAEDTLRQLDEFEKVRCELQDGVRAQFPEGIEQSEPSNWAAVGNYWAIKKKMGAHGANLTSLPLPREMLNVIGQATESPELVASTAIVNNIKTLVGDK